MKGVFPGQFDFTCLVHALPEPGELGEPTEAEDAVGAPAGDGEPSLSLSASEAEGDEVWADQQSRFRRPWSYRPMLNSPTSLEAA
mmetsp:Transcript_10793/g.30952  ORF Transcript_10793/g.30952 Transcript_10793/m.30952 type:complete len:85 (-) Transcript_10793:162-416(-)